MVPLHYQPTNAVSLQSTIIIPHTIHFSRRNKISTKRINRPPPRTPFIRCLLKVIIQQNNNKKDASHTIMILYIFLFYLLQYLPIFLRTIVSTHWKMIIQCYQTQQTNHIPS